jgi:hypothetical protein
LIKVKVVRRVYALLDDSKGDRVRMSIASSFPPGSGGASAARTSVLPGHESSPLDRIRPAGFVRPLFVAWLLLSAFVTHDALILVAGRSRLHAFLAAMFAALILHTFQIVFLWHCDHPFRICSSMRFRATGSSDTMADRRESKEKSAGDRAVGHLLRQRSWEARFKSPRLNRAAHLCGPINR